MKIETMNLVNAFLTWPLPASVCCDPCATKAGYPNRVGTNLLTADEARQMFEYVVDRAKTPVQDAEAAADTGKAAVARTGSANLPTGSTTDSERQRAGYHPSGAHDTVRNLVQSQACATTSDERPCEVCGETVGAHHLGGQEHTFIPEQDDAPDERETFKALKEAHEILNAPDAEGERRRAEEVARQAIANWQAMPLKCEPGQSSTVEGYSELLARDEAQLCDAITNALLQFNKETKC